MRKTFASFQGIELADHFTGKIASSVLDDTLTRLRLQY